MFFVISIVMTGISVCLFASLFVYLGAKQRSCVATLSVSTFSYYWVCLPLKLIVDGFYDQLRLTMLSGNAAQVSADCWHNIESAAFKEVSHG